MPELQPGAAKRAAILDAAIPVFGRFGFRKTSVNDLAAAAGLSKQGLYLHFVSKEAVFVAAMEKYLSDGLTRVDQALKRPDAALQTRLLDALDAWFGRHLATFTPASFDVIEAGNFLSGTGVEGFKHAFMACLATALAGAPACSTPNGSTPDDVARVLFTCGLSWKEGVESREAFRTRMTVCVQVCGGFAREGTQ